MALLDIEPPQPYQRVAVALDFSGAEEKLLAESLRFVSMGNAQLVLLHVVESPVARTLGAEGEDLEIRRDQARLEELTANMREAGITTEWRLGTGNPVPELARMINETNADVVIVGSHGHSGVSDLIHGSVINDLRHRVRASVLVVPTE